MKNAAGNSSISYTITLWKNTPLFLKIKKRLLGYETASSYFHRKEYVPRITEGKTEATGKKRMAEALAMIAEGKGRYWKYQKNKISS